MELTKNTSVDPAQMIGKNYIEAVNAKFPNTILDEEWSTPNQVTLTIKTNMLPDVVEYLYYQHEGWLPLVFGNDERSIHGNYAVYYVLSMEGEVKTFITIKALVDPVSLEFPSVTPKVKAAVWGERELFDMYGLKAVGLPDQRRLVLPDDWPDDLYPLRKDSMDYRLRPDPTTATETYEFDVPVSPDYLSNDIKVQLAYGSYYYSYELTQAVKAGKVTEEAAKACKYAYAYGTSENVNAHGTLAFTDISLMGEKYTQSVIPPKQTTKAPETTKKATTTTKVPTGNTNTVAPTTAAPAVVASKPAQVKGVKVVNNAKKSVKVTWKKAKGAKSYQVKVGKKKYNAKKTNAKIKKLAVGKTYKVQVRAKNAAGFGKWSKAVKVTIKK